MDCIDLARLRAVGCDADCSHHACGRHAPCMGKAVHDNSFFMAALGFGNYARTASWPSVPSREIKTLSEVVCTHGSLRCYRTDVRCLDDVAGDAVQSLCRPIASGTVRTPFFRQVL